jgi:hypothetical protein
MIFSPCTRMGSAPSAVVGTDTSTSVSERDHCHVMIKKVNNRNKISIMGAI